MCGWQVKAGQRLIVYAYGDEPVGLSYCSRTGVADLGSPDIPVTERILRASRHCPFEQRYPCLSCTCLSFAARRCGA